METFNHAVGLRVIGSSPSTLGTSKRHEGVPKPRFKLASTVGDDSGRHTKSGNPPTEEGLSHSFCSNGSERNSFRPACEAVDTGDEIGESSRWWQWSNKVNVDDIKTSIRGWERVERAGCVSLDLGTLTVYAGASPAANIRVNARPNEPRGEEFLGGSNSWV